MKKYLEIFQYTKGQRHLIFLNIVFNFVSTLFSLLLFQLLYPFLELIFGISKLPAAGAGAGSGSIFSIENISQYVKDLASQNIGDDKTKMLIILCIMIVILAFGRAFFQYMSMWIITPLRQGVVKKLRAALYDKILRLPISFFSDQRKGDMLTRMSSDVNEIEWGILNTIEVTTRDPFMILVFLGALFVQSPQLTIFTIFMLIITGLIIGRTTKNLKKDSIEGQEKLSQLLSLIEETLGGVKIIKAFVAEDFMRKKMEQINSLYTRTMVRLVRIRDLASPMSEFLGVCILAIVLYYGGTLILSQKSNLDGPAFIVYIALFSQLIQPAKNFSRAFSYIQKAFASWDRLQDIFTIENKMPDAPQALTLTGFEKEIKFENVSFSFADGKEVIKDFQLTIPKGKMVALVGQSGAGKSTLADLLLRFHDVSNGQITIDGTDIRDVKSDSLRSIIGLVNQEALLFNDTIENNIAFGTAYPDLDSITQAARIANAHDFIMLKEGQYQSSVGERGSKLSGGERQRITIARAVLKNPPILILDEATAALDAESERLVQDALYKLLQNRTSIVIAHRLSTIQHADKIVVLQEGKIVEEGTHSDLIAKQGYYKKLVDMQSFQ